MILTLMVLYDLCRNDSIMPHAVLLCTRLTCYCQTTCLGTPEASDDASPLGIHKHYSIISYWALRAVNDLQACCKDLHVCMTADAHSTDISDNRTDVYIDQDSHGSMMIATTSPQCRNAFVLSPGVSKFTLPVLGMTMFLK